MEIERLNEFTLKFFITYGDIEARGFDREEIWYNRERGEEFFWEMMDEAHAHETFSLEGPLWIQVQALENGLELLVTKANMSKDGSKLELPISDEKQIDIPVDDSIENILDHHAKDHMSDDQEREELPTFEEDVLSFLLEFKNFEDIITLSHHIRTDVQTDLYYYNDQYFINVTLDESMEEDEQDNLLSRLYEFGFDAKATIYVVKEYGKTIISDNAFAQVREHFPFR